SEILKALADPTRLAIALCLRDAKEPVCICDFTATFDISQPTVSHHMAKLRDAGLVEVTKRGIWSFYRLASELPGATRRILDAVGWQPGPTVLGRALLWPAVPHSCSRWRPPLAGRRPA